MNAAVTTPRLGRRSRTFGASAGPLVQSMRIVPVCPYVAKFLKKHEEFADITDPVTPEILRRLKTELRTLT